MASESNLSFQDEVGRWMIARLGSEISSDHVERNHRFLEEAIELVQSGGCTASEAHQLVDYVFGRPVGELKQEVGGTMVTLAALCLAHGVNMTECGATEIARCWQKIDKIRAKQAAKPKHSPLPEEAPPAPLSPRERAVYELVEKAKQIGFTEAGMQQQRKSWVIGEMLLSDPWLSYDECERRYEQAIGGR
jgi:hypothetical protein